MKYFLLFFLLGVPFSQIKAQQLVDTLPHNKNVLIEEFTGVECNSCPSGHIEIANLISAYPNRVFAACMHSLIAGHTNPFPGDEDLRREFPDSLFLNATGVYGQPYGILNRRPFIGGLEGFIFWPFNGYKEPIDSCANIIMNEQSPFNIGIKAEYDSISKVLQVKSEIYTTSSTVGMYRLNVYFTESNIYTKQQRGSDVVENYNQKHVFREILTPFKKPYWGELIAINPNMRSSFSFTNLYLNDYRKYKMKDVEVIVFITEHSAPNKKGVVVHASGSPVTMVPHIFSGEQENNVANNIFLYPNPASNHFYLFIDNPSINNEIIISDLNGQIVYKKQIAKEKSIYVEPDLTPGVYILSLKNNSWVNKKIIIY